MANESLVKFYYGTQEYYDNINNYENDALYFIIDTNKLYKGDTLIANYVNERVIAAALVDLNTTVTRLDSSVLSIDKEVKDISVDVKELDEVFAATANDLNDKIISTSDAIGLHISSLEQRVTDVSADILILDRVLSVTANDLNDKIGDVRQSLNELIDLNLDTVSSQIEEITGNLYDVSTDLQEQIDDLSSNLNSEISVLASDTSARITDVSANVDELDYVLAMVSTQMDSRMTDVSTIATQNAEQLNWIVINN